MASSPNRVKEVRAEIDEEGAGREDRSTGNQGLGALVNDIVDTYIYEYFLYEGTDADVAERLNTYLNTYQPDWAMEKEVDAKGNPTGKNTGNIAQVDPAKMSNFRVHLYSLWETNVASRLFTNLASNFWGDGDAAKRSRVIGENLGDIFYEEASGSFPSTKGWCDRSQEVGQPAFFGWPTGDLSDTGAVVETGLAPIDWYTFVNTAANTGLFTVGSAYGDNRPTYKPMRDGVGHSALRKPLTTAFQIIFVDGKAPIAKHELYYTEGAGFGATRIRSRHRWIPVLEPNSDGEWVPMNATKEHLYGDEVYFMLRTGRELIGDGSDPDSSEFERDSLTCLLYTSPIPRD